MTTVHPPDPSTYQGQPIERWKMVMVEHVAALRQRNDELEHQRNAANARAAVRAREGKAHERADKLQRRLDQAMNTIAHLQRRLMEVQSLGATPMKEAV